MKCPFCAAPDSRVVDSRTTDDGNSIRRRRECTVCGKRFTTYETVEKVPLMVIKMMVVVLYSLKKKFFKVLFALVINEIYLLKNHQIS